MPSRAPHCARAALLCLAALALPLAACGQIPKDPEDTLRHVEHGVLRVGVLQSPPWASGNDTDPSGVEVELVRRLAAELDARLVWVNGGESALLTSLERFQLDLVIGGVTDESPWRARVGLTEPHFTEHICVGIPASAPPLHALRGSEVAVRLGDPVAARLEKKGAHLTPLPSLSPERAPLAAPDWQLDAWRLQKTSFCLEERRHVLAAPPGENGWILRVERFLRAHRGEVRPALSQNPMERAER